MNQRQLRAFQNPCFEAEECMDLRFARRERPPSDDATTILTLNIGLE